MTNLNICPISGIKSEKEAALIYNEIAKKQYGKFANLNIIE